MKDVQLLKNVKMGIRMENIMLELIYQRIKKEKRKKGKKEKRKKGKKGRGDKFLINLLRGPGLLIFAKYKKVRLWRSNTHFPSFQKAPFLFVWKIVFQPDKV